MALFKIESNERLENIKENPFKLEKGMQIPTKDTQNIFSHQA
jgi:hypothetical protein